MIITQILTVIWLKHDGVETIIIKKVSPELMIVYGSTQCFVRGISM